MVAQLADVLASASLTPAEQRVVERLVERLSEELGSNLCAIWLFGSRARGEPPHSESDIDLMVLVEEGHAQVGTMATELAYEISTIAT
jgi:predicted nucleotidyltransferase